MIQKIKINKKLCIKNINSFLFEVLKNCSEFVYLNGLMLPLNLIVCSSWSLSTRRPNSYKYILQNHKPAIEITWLNLCH